MTINELSDIVNNWFEEDENNRSVFMVMTDRNDIKEHLDFARYLLTENDNNNFIVKGRMDNLNISLGTAIKMSPEFCTTVVHALGVAVSMDCDMIKQISND